MRLDQTRQGILTGMWDKKLARMIVQLQQSKGKKNPYIVRKLKAIAPEVRDHVISQYYAARKTRYLQTLKKYFESRHALNAVHRTF